MPTDGQDPASGFGGWLRELRQARNLTLREVAAAAQMDQALLSNIERGVRWPSDANAAALAKFFATDFEEFSRRLVTAKIWRKHADNPAFVTTIATQVQEDAAAFGVSRAVKKKK